VSHKAGRLKHGAAHRISWCGFSPSSALILWAILLPGLACGSGGRLPNTTLRLPPNPPIFGYTATNAFGNLSFSRPVGMVTPSGETNRLFVVEQSGRISVITNLAAPSRTVFLDLTDRVLYDSSEEGLLALAFHPGYTTNRYFYVWYSARSPSTDRLSRFEADPANPTRALPASEVVLINQLDGAPNHNGGELLFGADGYLYLSLGDEGHSVFMENYQRIDRDFFSGIIRIDVDKRPRSLVPNSHAANTNNAEGTFNYAIPADNPFIGATSFNGLAVDPAKVRTEFWAAGLRNPWRMSFDKVTGLLYCADVGQSSREEVNIIIKGGNYGWPYREGFLTYGGFGQPPPGFRPVPPIVDYARGSGTNQGSSVTGGFVYRGTRYSDLYGTYIFADYVSGNIWALRYDATPSAGTSSSMVRIATRGGISSFAEDPSNGDVLMAGHYDNRILRLVRAASDGQAFPQTLLDTGAFSNLVDLIPNPGITAYEINVPFWSDHAAKTRWFSVPNTNLVFTFNPTNSWFFPTGAVWIKHFDLELTNGAPDSAKRLETRFLVRNENGVYGVTYRWNSTTNATLVPEDGLDESFVISDGGTMRTQTWHYPARSECLTCHTPQAGFALGFNTRQLNRDWTSDIGIENQLSALSRAGYFDSPIPEPQTLVALAHATNTSASLETRVRSYLDANCVHCHQPGGSAQGLWDARTTTPLTNAGIIDGLLMDYMGDPNNRVVKLGSLSNSVIYKRVATPGTGHMPPLATSELNHEAIALLGRWITNDLATPLPLLSTIAYRSGTFIFQISGPPAREYVVESSTNLILWNPVTTNMPPEIPFEFRDSVGESQQRAYRVRLR
jgi:glucose/arabinose dehydrogenase/mono/diheme cytochrome c family protein